MPVLRAIGRHTARDVSLISDEGKVLLSWHCSTLAQTRLLVNEIRKEWGKPLEIQIEGVRIKQARKHDGALELAEQDEE